MALLESTPLLIGGDQININQCATYTPTLEEARTRAVLFSGSHVFDRRHRELVMPQVTKEDVLHADDIYARILHREDSYGVSLAEEREQRLELWDALGVDIENMREPLDNEEPIKAITIPELVRPYITLHLEQERRAARFVLTNGFDVS